MARKVLIIGGGVAGLAAGSYLRMNGYDTEILELAPNAGGLCCWWERKHYTIEGCLHWLVGSASGSHYNRFWREVADMSSVEFVDFEDYMRIEDREGHAVTIFTDAHRLERELLRVSHRDRKLVSDFVHAVRKFAHFQMPAHKAPELYTPWDSMQRAFRAFPYLPAFRKWHALSAAQLAEHCKHPLLRRAFEMMFMPDMSALFLILMLAWMHRKDAGYPIGGAKKLTSLMEDRYRNLGGSIRFNTRVRRIITDNDTAMGVETDDGEKLAADIVVSAADGHSTLFEMLDSRYLDATVRSSYEQGKLFPSYVQVSLGIRRTFEEVAHWEVFPLKQPLEIDPETRTDYVGFRFFNFDPTLAPEGSTLVTGMFPTRNYVYWTTLRDAEPRRYRAEKKRVADEVIEVLEEKYGGIKGRVDMVDVSTPATVIRYTGNWRGSFEGWLLRPGARMGSLRKTLPGLKHFYMAGQWVEPGGGLPTAMLSGRNVAQLICKKDKKSFETSLA